MWKMKFLAMKKWNSISKITFDNLIFYVCIQSYRRQCISQLFGGTKSTSVAVPCHTTPPSQLDWQVTKFSRRYCFSDECEIVIPHMKVNECLYGIYTHLLMLCIAFTQSGLPGGKTEIADRSAPD